MYSPSKTLRMTKGVFPPVKLDTGLDIDLLPEVYSPSDDSFLLLEIVELSRGETFLEMGSGSGLVSVHAAKAGARVVAADINPNAVACTRRNASRNGVRVEAIESDLFEKVPGVFDVIAFNPPYLPQEATSTSWMERSWSGGGEGSEIAVRFMEHAWMHLAPRGKVFIILSSLGGVMSVLKAAKERYDSQMLIEKHMFFESIFGYRFALKSSVAEIRERSINSGLLD